MMNPIARLDDEHRILEGYVALLEHLVSTAPHDLDLRAVAVLSDHEDLMHTLQATRP